MSAFDDAYNSLVKKFPKRYKVAATTYLKGILSAIADGDAFLNTQVEQVRENEVVITATGQNLDRLASNYGITRGRSGDLQDTDFQKLIPVLGMTIKQVMGTLQRIIDVIYGPYASHANVTSSAPGPYNISNEPSLLVQVDGSFVQIDFKLTDAVNPFAATPAEIAAVITDRSQGQVLGSVVSNIRTGDEFVNIRTQTIGPQGFVQVLGGDAQAILQYPEIRPINQTIDTWNVTRYQGSDEMVYTVVSGVSPALINAGVKKGDYVTIRETSNFFPENCGSFLVTSVQDSSFRVQNPDGIPESNVTQATTADFVFFKSNVANILLSSRPATILNSANRELTVIIPVTSPIVKRTLKGGAHFHGGLSLVTGVTTNSITVGSSAGFNSAGAFKVCISRKNSEGTVSSVNGTDVTLISGEGWPSSGSFYCPTTETFYYYNAKSGNILNGVSPTPPSLIAGAPAKYAEKYSYTSITGNTLNGVYPDPSATLGFEVAGETYLQGSFIGSFLYDTSAPFSASSISAKLNQNINQGDSLTIVQVDDVSAWPDQGSFVVEFATKEQEGPIKYYAKVGSGSLIIDPGHVFTGDHLSGVRIRLLNQVGAYIPRTDGSDYAAYITGTSAARDLLAQYLADVAAYGIVIKFRVIVPDYKWPVLPLLYAELPLDTSLATVSSDS